MKEETTKNRDAGHGTSVNRNLVHWSALKSGRFKTFQYKFIQHITHVSFLNTSRRCRSTLPAYRVAYGQTVNIDYLYLVFLMYGLLLFCYCTIVIQLLFCCVIIIIVCNLLNPLESYHLSFMIVLLGRDGNANRYLNPAQELDTLFKLYTLRLKKSSCCDKAVLGFSDRSHPAGADRVLHLP